MVEIVSAHTDLRRQGVRYTGLCPFHDERSPSFSVQSEEKLYHCFGCGVGGDLFVVVIAIENVDFPTAVESLSERYGVEVKREDEDPQAEERRKARQRLTEADLTAGDFVRAMRQLLDLLDQVADAAGDTPLRQTARQAAQALRRGVVDYATLS